MKRTKKRNGKPSEIVESLGAAASRLGIDLHLVQAAKAAGCGAFRPGGRVHLAELREHFDKNPVTKAFLPPLSDEQVAAQAGIEDSLAGAIRDELEIGRELQQARQRGNTAAVADLTLAISRARKARLAIEAAVTKLRMERGELIPKDVHERALRALWIPFVNGFRLLPRKLSSSLASVDEIEANRVIEVGVEGVLAEIRKVFEKTEDEADQMHLQDWVNLGLEVDPTGAKVLEKLDALRARAVVLIKKARELAVLNK